MRGSRHPRCSFTLDFERSLSHQRRFTPRDLAAVEARLSNHPAVLEREVVPPAGEQYFKIR